MLKIKDSIDLKELEKFGFENNYNDKYLIKSYKDRFSQDDYMTVSKEDKIIRIQHYQDEYGATNIIGMSDLLYDLIQEGLVEKVSD